RPPSQTAWSGSVWGSRTWRTSGPTSPPPWTGWCPPLVEEVAHRPSRNPLSSGWLRPQAPSPGFDSPDTASPAHPWAAPTPPRDASRSSLTCRCSVSVGFRLRVAGDEGLHHLGRCHASVDDRFDVLGDGGVDVDAVGQGEERRAGLGALRDLTG